MNCYSLPHRNGDCLVSVLMPCSSYNDFVEIALNSILEQTYSNLEILIVANGVSDEEYVQLDRLKNADNRICLIRTKVKGLVFALNLGIHLSKGEYIARMDSDDISLPLRIEKQVAYLESNTECSVVGCKVGLIDEFGEALTKKFPFYEHHHEIKKILPIRNVLCHPALMFRKSALLNVGCYKFGFMSEDHELFLRMSSSDAIFHNLDMPLFQYRRHSSQITNIKSAWKHFFEISAFLYMHAFLSKQYKCFFGMIVVFPPVRKLYSFFKKHVQK